MIKKILIFITFSISIVFAKTSSGLNNNDIHRKINEILQNHVKYKKIDNILVEKILRNFIDELDPSKTYFIESEIDRWLFPSEKTKSLIIKEINKKSFQSFYDIQKIMIKSIERRNEIEKKINNSDMDIEINNEEFKDLDFTKSKDELIERLQKIKIFQKQTAQKYYDEKENLEKLEKIAKKRRLNREKKLQDDTTIKYMIIKSLAASLDAHTTYFTPQEAKQFMIDVQRRMFGIGALLRDNLNGFSVTRIVDGSPAQKCKKLKVNDLIIAVDNKPVIGMDLFDAVELIRGKKGTTVDLTILRKKNDNKNKKFNVKIKRDEIVLEDSRIKSSFQEFGDGIIGYIKLFSFYQDPKNSSYSDIKKAIDSFKKEGNLKGLILDLRDNTGGALTQAVEVSGLFISKGIVVSIKDCIGNVRHLRNTDGKIYFEKPLIILCNRASASAAEIVAGTLQDYGRAIIVGDEKTFGKGSFQTFSLDGLEPQKNSITGEFKVTRGLYFTVSGNSPQLKGIKTNIKVPGILSKLDIGEEFSKNPLGSESIESNFEDNLSDIANPYKEKIGLFYRHNLQKKLDIYEKYMPTLKKNSENRIIRDINYQNFLKKIEEKKFDDPEIELFEQTDMQLKEAYNIMKDLIFLMENKNNIIEKSA